MVLHSLLTYSVFINYSYQTFRNDLENDAMNGKTVILQIVALRYRISSKFVLHKKHFFLFGLNSYVHLVPRIVLSLLKSLDLFIQSKTARKNNFESVVERITYSSIAICSNIISRKYDSTFFRSKKQPCLQHFTRKLFFHLLDFTIPTFFIILYHQPTSDLVSLGFSKIHLSWSCQCSHNLVLVYCFLLQMLVQILYKPNTVAIF